VSASCTNKNVYKKVNKKDCYQRTDHQQKTDKTERARELGRKTREVIGKVNQTTALRIQTGGQHQTSLASLRGKYTGP